MMAAKRCGTHDAPCNALSSVPIRNCIPRSTISSAWCQHATSRILSGRYQRSLSKFLRTWTEGGTEKRERGRGRERERKKNGTIESSESDWSTARCRLTDPVCAAGQTFASTTKPLRFDNDERIHQLRGKRIFLPVLLLIPIIGSSTPSDDELTTGLYRRRKVRDGTR